MLPVRLKCSLTMSIDLTSWCATSDTVVPSRLALAMALRRALPARQALGSTEWAYGTRREILEDDVPNARVLIRLDVLRWRLLETLEFHQRPMGEWAFSGVGWVANQRVDFAGEYLRDFATGAFWEFKLHEIGCVNQA